MSGLKDNKLQIEEKQQFEILMELLPFPKDLVYILIQYLRSFRGEFVEELENNESKLHELYGIASDGVYIYVADRYDGKIKTLDKKCQVLYAFDQKIDGDFIDAINIFIYNSLLYVTDWRSSRVCVLTGPELKLIKCYSFSHRCWGICIYNSEIYLPLYKRIEIYTIDGVHKREIDLTRLSVNPYDMYIDDNIIYICCSGSNRILLYSLEGIFLSTFEFNNNDKQGITNPQSVTVIDNYVYISDYYWVRQCTKKGRTIKKWKTKSRRHRCLTFLDGKCYVTDGTPKITIFE